MCKGKLNWVHCTRWNVHTTLNTLTQSTPVLTLYCSHCTVLSAVLYTLKRTHNTEHSLHTQYWSQCTVQTVLYTLHWTRCNELTTHTVPDALLRQQVSLVLGRPEMGQTKKRHDRDVVACYHIVAPCSFLEATIFSKIIVHFHHESATFSRIVSHTLRASHILIYNRIIGHYHQKLVTFSRIVSHTLQASHILIYNRIIVHYHQKLVTFSCIVSHTLRASHILNSHIQSYHRTLSSEASHILTHRLTHFES